MSHIEPNDSVLPEADVVIIRNFKGCSFSFWATGTQSTGLNKCSSALKCEYTYFVSTCIFLSRDNFQLTFLETRKLLLTIRANEFQMQVA